MKKEKQEQKNDVDKRELYELSKVNSNISLVIRSSCELKIRQLIQMYPNTEWSGFLIYKTVTPIDEKFTTGSIEAIDLFPMDVGNSTFTNFGFSSEFTKYLVSKKLFGKCQYGLIHSHHTMRTTPSGTDINTIREEGTDNNHFVSLIVNTEGTYSAFITRRVTEKNEFKKKISYNTFDDKLVEYEISGTEKKTVVEYTEMKVVKSYPNGNEIIERVKNIENAKKAALEAIKKAKKANDKIVRVQKDDNGRSFRRLINDGIDYGTPLFNTARDDYYYPKNIPMFLKEWCIDEGVSSSFVPNISNNNTIGDFIDNLDFSELQRFSNYINKCILMNKDVDVITNIINYVNDMTKSSNAIYLINNITW